MKGALRRRISCRRVAQWPWHQSSTIASNANDEEERRHTADVQASRLGLVADTFLVLAKGSVGFSSGSSALAADAAHSVADIVSSAVVYLCVQGARAPADTDHPFGHGKYQSFGTLVMGGALVTTGAAMGWHSAAELAALVSTAGLDEASVTAAVTAASAASASAASAVSAEAASWPWSSLLAEAGAPSSMAMVPAAGVAAASVGVKEGLYRYTRRVGERTRNALLVASAWHHRSDALSSVVALAGIAGGAFLGAPALDPVAGVVVSGMIAKIGVEAAHGAVQELLDADGLSSRERAAIERTVRRLLRGVRTQRHIEIRDLAQYSGVAGEEPPLQEPPQSSPSTFGWDGHLKAQRRGLRRQRKLSGITAAAGPSDQGEDYEEEEEEEEEEEGELSEWEGVALRRLRGRKMGPFLMLDMDVEVPPRMSASAAHHIAEHIRRAVMEMGQQQQQQQDGSGAASEPEQYPSIGEVNVHVEPRGAQHYYSPGSSPSSSSSSSSPLSSSMMPWQRSALPAPSLSPSSPPSSPDLGWTQAPSGYLIPLPHEVEDEVRRVVMKLNTEEGAGDGSRRGDDCGGGGGSFSGLPKRPLRGVRAIGGVSECQCYYIDDRLHVKLDLILDPRLLLGEAHAIARLVRTAVLEECSIEGLADVDVDLELDEKGGSTVVA